MLAPWKESYEPRQCITKQRHYFANKGLIVKAMVFPVVMHGCESWTVKKAECWRTDVFWTVVLEKTLESPLDCREIKPVNPKRINPEYSLEGLMLKLKLQHFGHLMWKDSLEKSYNRKDWRQEKGMTEDEMVGWHHRLNGHEFEQTPGDGEGQGSLAFCSPWGRKESDTTEQLNNNFSYAGNTSRNITEVKGQCCPAWNSQIKMSCTSICSYD